MEGRGRKRAPGSFRPRSFSDRTARRTDYVRFQAKGNDDVIYTKDVLVLKDDDYRTLERPFAVDVVTCAAPNLREDATNAYNPSDGDRADIPPAELLALHEKRGRRILSAAAANGAQALVLGAFGCGAFRNDPDIVARAYANILPAFRRHFRVIEFAVFCRPRSTQNYEAFRKIV